MHDGPRSILHLITRGERGGAQTYVLELLKAAQRRGARPVLAVGEAGFLSDAAAALGIDVHRVENLVHPIRPRRDLAAVAEVARLLRRVKPDLVHCHSTKAGLVGRLGAWRAGVPAVFTAHGWEFAPGLAWSRRVVVWPCEWLAGRFSAKIIAVSGADRTLAHSTGIIRDEHLATIRYGVPDDPRRATPDGAGPVELVMVARLAPPKDPDTLLRALRQLRGDWRMTLVGGGPGQERARAVVREHGMDARVCFLGDCDDVPGVLARCHVFVLMSKKEGLPISILEAMRAGLPVVAADVGGVREQVTDGETGYLVPSGDDATLARRLQTLVDDPSLRRQMGQAGRARYEGEFTLDRMVERTWAVYRDALTRGGAPAKVPGAAETAIAGGAIGGSGVPGGRTVGRDSICRSSR